MVQEFCIKCWQFLLEVSGLIWIFCHFSFFLYSHSSRRGWECPILLGFCLISFFTFFSPLNPKFNNLSSFLLPTRFSCYSALGPNLLSSLTSWRRKFLLAVPVQASVLSENKDEGLTSLFQRYSECLPQWDLVCQWHQTGSRLFLFIECRCSMGSKE